MQQFVRVSYGTDGYAAYWSAMAFALRFAEVNRSRMLDQVEIALGIHTRGSSFARTVDIQTTTPRERITSASNGIVHRKGARARTRR